MRRASLSLRGKLLLGFVLPTGLAIAAAVVVYRGLAVSVATGERVNLTNQVIAFANVALRAAVEAEAQTLLNEAENVLTDEARYSLFRRRLLDKIEGIVRDGTTGAPAARYSPRLARFSCTTPSNGA